MSEWFTYGSVRGAAGDGGPYRDIMAGCRFPRGRARLPDSGGPGTRMLIGWLSESGRRHVHGAIAGGNPRRVVPAGVGVCRVDFIRVLGETKIQWRVGARAASLAAALGRA